MIAHIVPNFHPALDGVGDYAFLLAKELQRDFGINSIFLVANSTWNKQEENAEFPVLSIHEHSVSAILSTLTNLPENCKVVILHYVGYGYARKGTPFWLEKGIRAWKQCFCDKFLITFFHEIAASGYPWQSAFWLRPFQQQIVRELARASNYCLTSHSLNAAWLAKLAPEIRNDIGVLPIPSNVGELEQRESFKNKKARLIVFGTVGRRQAVYSRKEMLEKIVTDFAIEEIVDIGPKLGERPSSILNVPIYEKGKLTAAQILEIYADSRFGIIDYPTSILGKSAIFASYCSAGVVPIVVGTEPQNHPVDGLQAGVHYLIPEHRSPTPSPSELEEISRNVFDWYSDHSLKKHCEKVGALVTQEEYHSQH